MSSLAQDDLSQAPKAQQIGLQSFQLPALYRIGADGKIWIWIIHFDGEILHVSWETLNNFKAGIIQTSNRRVEMTSRSLSLYDQALQEAKHEYKNKKEKHGYREEIIHHDLFSLPAMLCTEWSPQKNQIHQWPVWVMPKIDGCRCRAHILPGSQEVHLLSRGTQVIHFLDHIRKQLLLFHQSMIRVLENRLPGTLYRLDGELYSSEFSFDEISGITRLTRNSNPLEGKLGYYLFDLILSIDLPYENRYMILSEAYQLYSQSCILTSLFILGASVANSKEDILLAHDYYVKQGFEGVIIRKIGGTESYYRGTRCTAIYKYKQFMDTEGKIIGAEAANGGHFDGAIIWIISDTEGRTFKVNPRGEVKGRKEIYLEYLKNPEIFHGIKYRYRYQEITSEGKPRFPIGLGMVFDR